MHGRVIEFRGLRFAPIEVDGYAVPEYTIRDGHGNVVASTTGDLGTPNYVRLTRPFAVASLRRAGAFVVVQDSVTDGDGSLPDVWLWAREEFEAATRQLWADAGRWGIITRSLPFEALPPLSVGDARRAWLATSPVPLCDARGRHLCLDEIVVSGGIDRFIASITEALADADVELAVSAITPPHDVPWVVYLDRHGHPEWTPMVRRADRWHLALDSRFAVVRDSRRV